MIFLFVLKQSLRKPVSLMRRPLNCQKQCLYEWRLCLITIKEQASQKVACYCV